VISPTRSDLRRRIISLCLQQPPMPASAPRDAVTPTREDRQRRLLRQAPVEPTSIPNAFVRLASRTGVSG
jgi:hypothetical protein